MEKMYFNESLEKTFIEYCKVNGIEDIEAFANRCALTGLSIVKFGTSPSDNINRENNGIKDIDENAEKKDESPREDEGKQNKEGRGEKECQKEEGSVQEKKTNGVKVRKIKVLKKE